MGNLDQSKLTAALRTPLGDNVLVIKSFTGSEGLGEPFVFEIEALSEEENIDFDRALGQPCSIKLKTYDNKERFFSGILVNAQWTGTEPGGDKHYSTYSLVLRPWFWLLNHSADCRIFHNKYVSDIIEAVFNGLGFSSGKDYRFQITADCNPYFNYFVQYRESDYAFVSRLMEEFGIYYYFEHRDDGQHTMVLVDTATNHDVLLPDIQYNTQVQGHNRAEQHLTSWVSDRRFCTGEFELNDYNYLHPTAQMRASKPTTERYSRSLLKVFDYPGGYYTQEWGEYFAKIRLEAEQALDRRRNALGDAPSLFPGAMVTLQGHPVKAENKKYLVVRANHRFGTQSFVAGGGQGGSYSGGYQLMTSDRQFRMLPLTPKPRIDGIQTAKVVGKQGEDDEDISTDEHGRIWVQFYWDRGYPLADNEEDRKPKKSCPVRVAQPWAGLRWGHQFIPRTGMEVVVEFEEGDPNRPLVTGCVYNGDNKVTYKLPDQKTQSGLKSESTKGLSGYNEFMFEDKKDQEFIRMHAEKDLKVMVQDSETRTIGNNRETTLKGGNDDLVLEKGDRFVACKHGSHTTYAENAMVVESDHEVIQFVIDQGVTAIDMTGRQLAMNSSEVEITAPMVRIMGNVQIYGNLMVVGQVVSLSAVVGGRPV